LDLSGADEHDDVADRHAVDPVEEAARSLGADRVQSAMRGLDPLEQEVLSLRYGFHGQPLGCTAVAAALELTRDRVRSIEARALRFLASAPGVAQLADPPTDVDAAS
jgi:DNA-directed RNA polymerase sigma subunit (sigma70/sigma32)